MKITVSKTAEKLGKKVAEHAASLLRKYISEKGSVRLLVATGASQFTTFEALCKEDVDWQKVEVFHLDEYINLPENHPASFIKYLNERFINIVRPGKFHPVDPSIGADEIMKRVSAEIIKSPIDVGLIGIGENAHIAFNDPPADFDDENAFKIVMLDEACRRQQLGEGWFKSMEEIPTEAITMTVKQILKCRHIISAVPYKVKAQAVRDTVMTDEITNLVPATALKTHGDWYLYLDEDSASMINV